MVVLDLPKYMNDVLHFSIQDNGIYSSIPQLIKLIMALVGGTINDWLIAADHLTITNGRKIFVAIGEFIEIAIQKKNWIILSIKRFSLRFYFLNFRF